MAKRNIGMKSLEPEAIESSGTNRVKQIIKFKNGIDKEIGKKINRIIKDSKLKVTSSYLDEKIRIQGKQIDDLQEAFLIVKNNPEIKIDLQMDNLKR